MMYCILEICQEGIFQVFSPPLPKKKEKKKKVCEVMDVLIKHKLNTLNIYNLHLSIKMK